MTMTGMSKVKQGGLDVDAQHQRQDFHGRPVYHKIMERQSGSDVEQLAFTRLSQTRFESVAASWFHRAFHVNEQMQVIRMLEILQGSQQAVEETWKNGMG